MTGKELLQKLQNLTHEELEKDIEIYDNKVGDYKGKLDYILPPQEDQDCILLGH